MVKAVYELNEQQKADLSLIFGEDVNFKKKERRFYTHDVGSLPPVVKMFLGNTQPAAIVKIRDEEQIVKLMEFARKYEIAVVPRAGASSGYGGVIPTKGGIIADVTPMHKIISIDKENMKVTVGAGIIWERLESKLNKIGLAAQAVPSSAMSATVGGWLAQNGLGYGSYEYGWSQDTMESARVVLPNGEIKDFKGDELQKIVGTMGTIGIITQLTLKVRKLEKTAAISAKFPDATSMQKAITLVGEHKVPLWSVSFINPEWAQMKNRAPPKTHYGESVEEHRPELPNAYICNFAYPGSRDVSVLKDIIKGTGGEILPDEIAEHETEEWFRSMKVKRLGPSFIPAEIIVPVSSIGKVFEDIDKKIALTVLVEGMVAKGNEAVLLCFIPHSELSFKFNMAFPLAISIVKIAEENGGRIYTSGLYFAKNIDRVFTDKLAKVQELKKQVDPKDVMNPETLTGKPMMKAGLSMVKSFEPLARFVGNRSGVGVHKFTEQKGIPGEILSHAFTCAQCGYCVPGCDQYYGRGWESQSPRGKWFFLKEYISGRVELDQEQVDTFLACTTCEMCDHYCQLDLPIERSWMTLRENFVQKKKMMTIPPFEIMAQSLEKERNIWANYRKDRDGWLPNDIRAKIKDKAEIAYFAGCTASFVEKDVAVGAVRLLDEAGIEFTYLGDKEACCGIPMLVAGKWKVFEKIMKMNTANMQKRGVKTVVTSCPACLLMWRTIYPQWARKLGMEYHIEARHYSEMLMDKLDILKPKLKVPLNKVVAWHDSCHIGRAGAGVYEPPRELLKAIPGVQFREMEHNREKALCCGSVVTLIDEPKVAGRIGNIRLQEAVDQDADIMAVLCPCCMVQFRIAARDNNVDLKIQDLGALAARSLGYDIPDTTHAALTAWATFDRMIDLMVPENMNEMMVELLPDMIGAMPSYMQKMMKVVKYVPGMDVLMKPMMPRMMSLLMPSLMPKVMPKMLKAVEKRVPMPDYMLEQMPDLMPAAMENLMPNMLPQIAPLLTPKMIEYIKAH
ncbi:FAD-binding and (Fe-S)-binding domain-containing protein [Methanomethylovorans sp.]|uniref:FAD-binding and (Fe-S)-binding domain-containing protein n=1 Tax=Methanomethylovorans sp. TaxID=2758717 RepID=UPI000B1318AA|nr:FAD-binding and (Fe-S)-binding domain-containing protein [Methanomethylovorans sp.]